MPRKKKSYREERIYNRERMRAKRNEIKSGICCNKAFRDIMSQQRETRSRDEVSLRRRPGNPQQKRDRSTEKEREKEKEKEKEKDGEGGSGRGIRTRLSTGSIHMNGTMTIAVAREIENNLSLKERSVKEYKGAHQEPAASTPVSASTRKRSIGTKESTPTSTRSASPEAVTITQQPPPKRRKIGRNDGSGEDNCNDYFCWLCHKEGTVVCCELCPRVFHTRCLEVTTDLPKDWVCPECEKIMRAECVETRSKAMSMISLDTFCTLLKYALERMKHQGSEPFTIPVDLSAVPYYTDYIFNPMDMELLEKNIRKKMYGCTEAFLADAKWILHNCIIFNGAQNKLTGSAKMIIKICKHEMNEIELCPDCYLSSCIRKNDEWFTEPCRTPHTVVWAKLKGYPFWPAKALREVDGQVDVRFFGAHDRSWVPTSQVFLLSKDVPTASKTKRGGFDHAMEELQIHIKKIKEKFGSFQYAPFRTPYDKNHIYGHNRLKMVNKRLKKNVFPPYKSETKYPVKIAPKPMVTTFDGPPVICTSNSPVKLKSSPAILRQNTPTVRHATAVRNKYNIMVNSRRSVNDSPAKSTSLGGADTANNTADTKVLFFKLPKHETVDSNSSPVKTEAVKKVDQTSSKLDENKKLVSKINIVDTLRNKFSALYKSDDEDSNSSIVNNDSRDSDHVDVNSGNGAEVVDSAKNSDDVTSKNEDDVEDHSKEAIEENLPQDEDLPVTANKDSGSEEKVEKTLVDGKSPSKTEYLAKLRQTIQSCKAKLGITGDEDLDKMEEEEESADDENEEEDEKSDDRTDDNKADEDNSCEGNSKKNISKDDERTEIKGKSDVAEDKIVNSEKDSNDMSDTKEFSCETTKSETTKSETSNSETTNSETTNSETINSETTNSDTINSETTNSDKEKVVSDKGCDEVRTEKIQQKNLTDEEVISKEQDLCVPDKPNSSERTISNCTEGSDSHREPADISEDVEMVTSLCESTGLVLTVKVPKTTPPKIHVKTQETGEDNTDSKTNQVMEVDDDENCPNNKAVLKSDSEGIIKAPTPGPATEGINKAPTPGPATEGINKAPTPGPARVRDEPQSDLDITEWESGKKSPIGNINSTTDVDSPRPASSSTTELSSQFFQSAVEKTLNPPTSTSPVLKPPQPAKAATNPTEDDIQVISDSYRNHNSDHALNTSTVTCLSSPPSSGAAVIVQDDEIEDGEMCECSESRPAKQDRLTDIPACARNLVSKFSAKLTAVMQETFEEICTEFVQSEIQKPKEMDTSSFDAEISRLEWEQKQQLVELKHNFQLALSEMKACWAAENLRIVSDLKATMTKEKDQAVSETKKKQWCANCGKEAIFYCCWNTSYCDYPCQQAHWPTHMPNCMQTQNSSNENEGDKDSNQSNSKSVTNNTSPQGTSNQSNQSSAPSQPGASHGPTRTDNPENVDDFRHRVRENFTNVLRQQHQAPHPPPSHPSPQGMPYLPPGANMPQHNFMSVQPGANMPRPEDIGGMTRYPVPPWSDQNMDAAFRAVIKDGMSVNKAAKVFKVPRNKLAERLGARTSTAPNMQALTGNQPLAGNHPVQFQYVGPPTPLMPPGVQHLNSQQQIQIQTVNVQNQPGSSPNNIVGQPQMMHQNNPVVYPLPQQILPSSQMIISQSGQQVPPGMINSSMPFPRHRFQ